MRVILYRTFWEITYDYKLSFCFESWVTDGGTVNIDVLTFPLFLQEVLTDQVCRHEEEINKDNIFFSRSTSLCKNMKDNGQTVIR